MKFSFRSTKSQDKWRLTWRGFAWTLLLFILLPQTIQQFFLSETDIIGLDWVLAYLTALSILGLIFDWGFFVSATVAGIIWAGFPYVTGRDLNDVILMGITCGFVGLVVDLLISYAKKE